MKQYVRLWGDASEQYLWSYLEDLVNTGYTIISVTPTEWYTKPFRPDHYQVVEAVIIVSK